MSATQKKTTVSMIPAQRNTIREERVGANKTTGKRQEQEAAPLRTGAEIIPTMSQETSFGQCFGAQDRRPGVAAMASAPTETIRQNGGIRPKANMPLALCLSGPWVATA